MHNAPVFVECQEKRGRHPVLVVAFTEHGFCLMRRQKDGTLSLAVKAVRLPDEMAKAILDVVRRQRDGNVDNERK